MPSLNTNVASLYASRNLMTAQSKMADSVERLSSGLRINRAKDDAAGLGISNALASQVNSANQGIRNLNDGISIVQTAEGAISAASDQAQRLLTLATQAKTGTTSAADRKSILNEMNVILSSISSMAARTKFGDKDLLMTSTGAVGTATKFEIAATANAGDSITLTNEAFTNIGVGTAAVTESTTFTFTSALTAGQAITIGGKTVTASATPAAVADVLAAFAGATTNNAAVTNAFTGFTAAVVGNTLVVTSTTTNTNVTDVAVTSVGNPGFTFSTTQGGAQSGGRAAALNTLVGTFSGNLTNSDSEATFQTTLTNIIASVNTYITDLNTQRTKLGAFQNQLESAVDNVSDLSVNLSAAKSRILDTDYATETASLTKGQILQQAATAMLAQANQMPNVILSLLK